MLKSDGDFNWKPGRLYIPWTQFMSMTTNTLDTASAAGDKWGSLNAGVPVTKEISTVNIAGVFMDAAGDMVSTIVPAAQFSPALDPRYATHFRVHWTSGSSTTADTATWIATYLALVAHDTAIIEPVTALDIAIPEDTVSGAYDYQLTDWGSLDGGTFTQETEAIALRVELDAFAAGLTEDVFFLGLEIRYTPKYFQSKGSMRHEAWENYGTWANTQ